MSEPTREPVAEQIPGPGSPWVRVRLDLAYDGTALSGWATQPGLRTVQGDVEAALARVLRLGTAPRLTVGKSVV